MGEAPQAAAIAAGLRYVNDDMPGIRRQKWGGGFSYWLPNGERLSPSPERDRIEALAIPPSWQEVWICPDPKGHLQATGRDAKGRKQYRYHPQWQTFRNLQKFDRMVPFGQALPALRQQTQAHLQLPNLSRQKVIAAVVQLLENTLIRVGNVEYARKNQSYGLTTLRDRHVQECQEPGELRFHFKGKSGVEHDVTIEDPKLARVVKQCRDIPGYELFQYYDEAGDRQTVRSEDVNDYLQRYTGEAFTAKDFRTWAGTLVAADRLYQLGNWDEQTEAQRNVVAAVKAAAKRLGNRPATCRKYYIHPQVPETYVAGEFLDQLQAALKAARAKPTVGLEQPEQAVLAFLASC